MEEIVDKYTGQTFRSRQEYDAFRRTNEWHNAMEEHYKKWGAEYECYFCDAKFVNIDELKLHHETEHMDRLMELSEIGQTASKSSNNCSQCSGRR